MDLGVMVMPKICSLNLKALLFVYIYIHRLLKKKNHTSSDYVALTLHVAKW